MKISLSKCLAIVAVAFVLAGCAASPIIDQNWISSNCRPDYSFVPDECGLYSCEAVDYGCRCRLSNGIYSGTLKDSKRHGSGTYTWNDGTQFRGWWKNGQKHCGIESDGRNYAQYKNGAILNSGNHNTGNGWGDVLAAALVVGAAAYIISEGGGGGGGAYVPTDTEFAWDYLPGSKQWRCRGVQTGRFAADSKCYGKYKVDNRWPGP